MRILYALLFIFAFNLSSADVYLTKIKAKNYYFWFEEDFTSGLSFREDDPDTLNISTNKPLAISDSEVGVDYVAKNNLKEELSFNVSVLLRHKVPIKIIQYENKKISAVLKKIKPFIFKKIYPSKTTSNQSCDFEYFDQSKIKSKILQRRISLMNNRIMSYYDSLKCSMYEDKKTVKIRKDTLGAGAADTELVIDSNNKNQLKCRNEYFEYKNRFLGINIYCRGVDKNKNEILKNFIEIYDMTLKSQVKRRDLTNSDFEKEDDLMDIEFGFSEVGLFFFYNDSNQKNVDHRVYIPFLNLQKSFSKWAKPKKYLRNFELN